MELNTSSAAVPSLPLPSVLVDLLPTLYLPLTAERGGGGGGGGVPRELPVSCLSNLIMLTKMWVRYRQAEAEPRPELLSNHLYFRQE